jgi:hypothetical protein
MNAKGPIFHMSDEAQIGAVSSGEFQSESVV